MNNSRFAEKIHSLGCDLDDERIRHILERITALKSLAFPAVCLPDLHLKNRTEAPSSFVAATEGTIVPELTAPSVGCGMGIIATSLEARDIDHNFFEIFYRALRTELGPRYGHFKNILLWLGIIDRPKKKYDLSVKEFEEIIRNGAVAAVKKYSLPPDTLEHVELYGSVYTKEEIKTLNLKNILPRISYSSGRHDIGYGFKGNHFLEIQYVEEILKPEKAAEWGLRENQIVIMYHGGGGAVSYHIGRYFANRKKNTLKQKAFLLPLKILFHFGSLKAWRDFPQRLRYYFFPRPFTEIPIGTREGHRLLLATKASLNYSYAFRMAIVRRIIDSIHDILPKKAAETHLVWDSSHNTIMEEIINGKTVMVHRHTANRVFEGKPVIVSGFNTTNSYIAVGLKEAENHLFSSDHGAGVTIQKFEKDGLTASHPKNHTTHIYQTRSPYKRVIHHITNEGIDYVIQKLTEERVAEPVARLRPLAVFKG